jgi:hypothetical protein
MKVTEEEMLEALNRSGYILESEIAKQLSDWDFFVQSGPVIKDPITGKGREIDIIAERYGVNNSNSDLKTHANIEYVFEIKNNSFPIVLLNKFRFSPNIDPRPGLKEAISLPNGIDYRDDIFFDTLIENNENVFTQYCSFHKKKGSHDLMASHPERFHDSISKIIQHCDEQVELYDQYIFNEASEVEVEANAYFRHRLYMPILLINDDLLEMTNEGLKKVDSSTLVVNYYHKGEPYMAYIFIITKQGLKDFINRTQNLTENVLHEMNEARDKQLSEYKIVLHEENLFLKSQQF